MDVYMPRAAPVLEDNDMTQKRNMAFVIFVTFTGALAGLLFGLDIGSVSGALPFVIQEFAIDPASEGWVVSVLMVGAAVGAVGGSWFSKAFGRKAGLIIAAALFVWGSVLAAWAPLVGWLIVGRFVLGLAVGVASFTAPLYLSEISPVRFRGGIISMYQLMITIGILAAYLIDTALSYSGAWRWMFGIPGIPSAMLLAAVLFLPRSPRWLAMRHRMGEANAVLTRLRETPEEARQEMEEIQESLAVKQEGWKLFKANPNVRRVVGLGMLLQIMQQFTGINVILYYAPKIFQEAGYATIQQQMWGTVMVGLINVLATFIAIGLVDRWGRRPMLTLGYTVMALSMGLLGLLFYLGTATPGARLFSVIVLLVFIIGFAMSAGPLVWVLCSEIQPLKSREFGIMCSTTTNWLANACIGYMFPVLLQWQGAATTFWLFAALNALFIRLTVRLTPETKGVSLEHLEHNLMAGKPLRDLGRPVDA